MAPLVTGCWPICDVIVHTVNMACLKGLSFVCNNVWYVHAGPGKKSWKPRFSAKIMLKKPKTPVLNLWTRLGPFLTRLRKKLNKCKNKKNCIQRSQNYNLCWHNILWRIYRVSQKSLYPPLDGHYWFVSHKKNRHAIVSNQDVML